MMTALIVDIQYYHINSCSVLKEATVLSLDATVCRHFVFRSNIHFNDLLPSDQKTAEYISHQLGVMNLHCGNDELSSFLSFIPSDTILFVNGHVKKTILKNYFPHHRIIDIKIPFRIMLASAEKCSFPCFHTLCSFTNVHKIRQFLFSNC